MSSDAAPVARDCYQPGGSEDTGDALAQYRADRCRAVNKFDRESLAFPHASGLVLSVPFLVPALDGFQRAGRGLGGREGA